MQACTALLLLCLLAACSEQQLRLSSGGAGAFEPDVAVTDTLIAVAWHDNRDGNDEIYLRLLSADLAPLTPAWRLTQNTEASYEAAVASIGDHFAVAWYDKARNGRTTVMLGMWDRQGSRLWLQQLSPATGSGRIPALQNVDGKLFIVWLEDSPVDTALPASTSLQAAWLDAAGNFLHEPYRIGTASKTTWNLNTATLPDGRVAIAYDAAFETARSELYLAITSGSGSVVSRLSEDDGQHSKYPDIAMVGNNAALTWFDMKDGNEEVYLAQLDVLQAGRSYVDQGAVRITTTPGESIGAYLAWNGTMLGLAWNDDSMGQHELFFRAFDNHLQPLAAMQQLTRTPADSMIPSIAALGDGFVIAWNEVVPGSGDHTGAVGTTSADVVVRAVAP